MTATLTKIKQTPLLLAPDLAQKAHTGEKTVTRRLIQFSKDPVVHAAYAKEANERVVAGWYPDAYNKTEKWTFWGGRGTPDMGKCMLPLFRNPYGAPGDLLWVRHNFYDLVPPSTNPANYQIWDPGTRIVRWRTGEEVRDVTPHLDGWRHRPSIHMPRWACRTWLKIKSVRAERVQEIIEADIHREGIGEDYEVWREEVENVAPPGSSFETMHQWFARRWNARYPGSWDRNEWVWRIEFERTEAPR